MRPHPVRLAYDSCECKLPATSGIRGGSVQYWRLQYVAETNTNNNKNKTNPNSQESRTDATRSLSHTPSWHALIVFSLDQKGPEAGINEFLIEDSAHLLQDEFLHLADILEHLFAILALAYLALDFDFF